MSLFTPHAPEPWATYLREAEERAAEYQSLCELHAVRIAELTAKVEALERQKVDDRRFPVLRGGSISWPIAELAYIAYCRQCGKSQSLERLAERGGFDTEELDEFVPGWREIEAQRDSRVAALTAAKEQAERESASWRRAAERLEEEKGRVEQAATHLQWGKEAAERERDEAEQKRKAGDAQ